jgi:CHRD domain
MRIRDTIATLTLSACLLVPTLARAETVMLKADLEASSEVPPTMGQGHGQLDAVYDTSSRTLSWNVTYDGLTGPASAAHFHGPAVAGKNAGVQVPIDKDALANPIHGQAALTDAQAKDLIDGKWYFNIHTAQNPGGEIRGQVQRVAQ